MWAIDIDIVTTIRTLQSGSKAQNKGNPRNHTLYYVHEASLGGTQAQHPLVFICCSVVLHVSAKDEPATEGAF